MSKVKSLSDMVRCDDCNEYDLIDNINQVPAYDGDEQYFHYYCPGCMEKMNEYFTKDAT